MHKKRQPTNASQSCCTRQPRIKALHMQVFTCNDLRQLSAPSSASCLPNITTFLEVSSKSEAMQHVHINTCGEHC